MLLFIIISNFGRNSDRFRYICPSVCMFVCHGCIVPKRCKIGLLLIANMKSYISFKMTLKSLTLDDLERYGMVILRYCG